MVPVFKFILVYIIPILELIPILFGILFYKYLTRPIKIIFYLAILILLMDSLNSIMAVVFHQLSKPYVDALAIIDFPLFSYFFILILSKKWKTPVIILLVVYYLLWIADFWFIEPGQPMNVYPLAFENILIMLFAIVYISQQTQTNIEAQWSANPVNWVNSGYLIYCTSSVMLRIFYNLMLEKHVSTTFFVILWEIDCVVSILQLILISIGFYKCRQLQTTSL